MTLTLTDLFCGAGGSSTGAIAVPGVNVRIAANHWDIAIAIHNANHPETDHAAVDLHQENPRFFPRTDILWASPECTKWSQAGGGHARPAIEEGLFEDPHSSDAATRSRLLMFDVLRFAEHHRYRAIIVENVVDIAVQSKYRLAWHEWRRQLQNLGYRFRVMSVNSMHAQMLGAPAPQSRDRIYIVAWLEGTPEPELERAIRPQAWCARCERLVEARQSWKNGSTAGRYRQSYVYVHGDCGTVVEPGYLPALAAIDLSIPGRPIGDRLTPKTRARVAAGIARYWMPFTLEAGGNTFERHPGVRTWSALDPLTTLMTTQTRALAVPVEGRDGKEASPALWPLRTQTTRAETAMVVPSGGTWNEDARPAADPLRTLTTRDAYAVAQLPFIAELRGGGSDARPVTDPAATFCASGTHHSLVTGDAVPLLHRNNSGGAEMSTPVTEYMRTLTTAGHQSLIQPPTPRPARRERISERDLAAAEKLVPECLFRMLLHKERAAGMAFPDDYVWQVPEAKKTSDRNLAKATGNSVCPPNARDLVGVVAAALA